MSTASIKTPKVLLVGPGLSGGGAQNRFRRTSESLFGGSADVAVFSYDDAAAAHFKPVIDLKWKGERSYPGMIGALRRHIRENAIDAVLPFGFYPNLLCWLALKGLSSRPALILSEINAPFREYLEDGKSLRGKTTHLARRMMYRGADLYAANSLDGVNDAIRYYGVAPERTRRLPNLVDPERLTATAAEGQSPQADARPSLCVITRLYRRKRVDTLLRAAAALPKDLAWQVDIAGDGDQTKDLKALAGELGIADRTIFHGWLKNPHPLTARATASLLCSEYEGFSNSILEAMVLGAPIVTSLCTSDAADMVEKGAALGFPTGDYSRLAEHLERLLREPDLRSSLRDAARKYAAPHILPGAIGAYEAAVLDAIASRARLRKPARAA